MKSNVMPSIVQIEANELKQLVTEVKETVATGIVPVTRKKANPTRFGIVDLWNIRRAVRTTRVSSRWFV
jgi:translation elongation factor EF-1beta